MINTLVELVFTPLYLIDLTNNSNANMFVFGIATFLSFACVAFIKNKKVAAVLIYPVLIIISKIFIFFKPLFIALIK